MPRPPRLTHPPVALRPGDGAWPRLLDDLPDPPSQIRVAGQLPPLEDAVAIVGTRYADEDALAFARALATELAVAGRVVISGGAWGIDAAAHRGALDVGGQTVVVLPTGLDRAYPARHRPLYEQIAAGHGALVTELPDGQAPFRSTFLARNRLIAALGACTLVVQAPARSGALSTAAVAAKLERPVFSVPYAPWEVRGEGCLQLLVGGARVCTSARDILSVRPSEPGSGAGNKPPDEEKRNALDGLDADCQVVFGLLSRNGRHPDELAMSAGIPISRVHGALLQLQLRGLCGRRADGTYATKAKTGHR
jgi:DNA processing protein